MAEKVIGLRLELNGFRGVVTSIKELEEELRKAKEDLTELEIGSENFKTLAREISGAESKLLDLRKASEGIGIEKKLEGYGKFAAGITSSFAAAQSAVALFGNESTAVAEAAAQAQNLLTLALSARGIEELKVGADIVARTIADKAATAAAATQNTVLKSLYTTIAANPIGALITAVGLLVGAMVLLNDTEEDVIKTQAELNATISDEAVKLNSYANILKDVNSSNEQRLFVVNELKKTYPGFNAFLDDENRLTKEGILFIDLKTKALNAQAKAQFISQQLAKLEIEALTIQNQSLDEQLTFYDKVESFFYRAVGGAQASFWKDVENGANRTSEALKGNTEQQDILKEALKDVSQESGTYSQELARLEALLKKQADADAKAAAAKNKVTKETKEEIKANQQLVAILTQEEKIKAQLLITDLELGEANADIVKGLEERITTAEGYKNKLEELKKVTDLLNKLEFGIAPQADIAGDAFNLARTAGEKLFDSIKAGTLTTEEYQKEVANLDKEFADIKTTYADFLTDEQLRTLDKYIISYKQFTDAVKVFSNTDIKPPFDAKTFEQDLIDVQLLLGKITLDPFERTQEEVSNAVLDAQERLQKDQEAFVKSYIDKRKNEFKDFNEQNSETTKELLKVYEEAGKEAFQNLVNAANEVIQFEFNVKQVQKSVDELNKKLMELAPAAREGFLLENKQALTQQFLVDLPDVENNQQKLLDITNEIQAKTFDSRKAYSAEITSLEKQLLAQGLDITKLSYEAKLELLKEFLTQEVDETAKAEKEKQDKLNATIEKINFALQTASKAITDIASLVAQSFQIQIDRLENNYSDAMENIVGDTEEANQKRIETEKAYQAEKAQIERRAQLSSLRFTLAQTIASGAQSIVSAAALPPPANIIVGALNAGITAAQVAIIQTQINDIQSRPLRRGGVLAMGGFIDGPSHEQGGVYAGGGYTLEGNESVINRQSTLQYSGLLSSINQSGGGRPIVVQSPMDSRLVEALAKQKTEPIRAYVVEQDITKAQSINRRLEQLASF